MITASEHERIPVMAFFMIPTDCQDEILESLSVATEQAIGSYGVRCSSSSLAAKKSTSDS